MAIIKEKGDKMQTINQLDDLDNIQIVEDDRWTKETPYLIMHSIHAYPAKFPPFLASNAFEYAEEEGVSISKVADIFCGCGTTALESKRRDISFWGCDINPVAVLITKAKVENYDLNNIQNDYDRIIKLYKEKHEDNPFLKAKERLKYWYDETTYNNLFFLRESIKKALSTRNEVEQNLFFCIYSAILKQCSRWLQKSIKPQVDPRKKAVDVSSEFTKRYRLTYMAIEEMIKNNNILKADHEIEEANFLTYEDLPKVDLILTSPPYVTSYEYADLHQLSSLWLEYADDYRELRKGSIGSSYTDENIDHAVRSLNNSAKSIIAKLEEKQCILRKRRSVAEYYSNMQKAVEKCFEMLNDNGMAVYIIGDSEMKGVKLDNSKHLIETMLECGFTDIKISKREVSKGICVPYRDRKGKFTKQDDAFNRIYHEEYIISGRKNSHDYSIIDTK